MEEEEESESDSDVDKNVKKSRQPQSVVRIKQVKNPLSNKMSKIVFTPGYRRFLKKLKIRVSLK